MPKYSQWAAGVSTRHIAPKCRPVALDIDAEAPPRQRRRPVRILAIEGAEHGILVNTISPAAYTRMHPAAGSRVSEADGKATMPVEAVAPAIVWLASDGCSETNRIYNVEAGTIQRIAIVMGPGFYDPHLTPESIAENYAKVESIEGFSEPGHFEPV